MPAKSNKFDYTNRASKGVRLGEIISNALQKEAEKIFKDGEKHSQKHRAQNASVDEEYTHTTHLDLRAPGRDLTDEAVAALADGLEIALQKGCKTIKIILEELNLSKNGLTSVSLRRLAPSIHIARATLRTLDLSYNNIRIETESEAEDWAAFLRAFDHCTTFQRLDLTGNHNLSPKALEILAELHIKSVKDIAPIKINQPTGDSAMDGGGASPASYSSLSVLTPVEEVPSADEETRSGLRSIPYFILDDVGLSDAGAMWLSYLLETHYFPCQLIEGLCVPTSEMQDQTESQGISWAGNDTSLGKDGKFLLRKATEIRQQLLVDASSFSYLEAQQSNQSTSSRARARPRGAGGRSGDGQEEFRSLVRKVQRSIIVANGGPCTVDLWRAALRVITLSRAFASAIGVSPKQRGLPCEGRNKIEYLQMDYTKLKAKQSNIANHGSSASGKQPRDSVHNSPARKKKKSKQTDNKQELIIPAGPDTAVTSANVSPPRTKELGRHSHKNAFSEGSDATDAFVQLAEKLGNLKCMEDLYPFVEGQLKRIATETQKSEMPDPFRNKAVPSHLPPMLLKKIIRMMLTKRETEALTSEQFDTAFAWGQDRGSLLKELGWSKDHFSAQIMKLLDEVNCLEFAREELGMKK